MQKFTATMDGVAKTITYVLLFVLVIPFYTMVRLYTQSHDLLMLVVPIVVSLALILAYLYRPQAYGLDASSLHVFRSIKPLVIPLKSILEVKPITTKELGFGIRTFGVGGFFGYFGKFLYKKHGSIWLYVTDRSKMLLVTLRDESQIMISPDDTAGFLNALQEKMRH
ncbi:MAG: hypothetical protein JST36_01090 [Bacteroidetes bacterium]|nr:hypothetical protein [Bacteroidota bacterium]